MLLQPGSKLPLPFLECAAGQLDVRGRQAARRGALRGCRPTRARGRASSRSFLDDAHDRGWRSRRCSWPTASRSDPAMAKLATHFWPRARVFRTRAQVEAWIVKASDSAYHPCGTRPHGPRARPRSRRRCPGSRRGVEGLRVADASLMPTIPASNIHLVVLMIGERVGAWLRGDGPQ